MAIDTEKPVSSINYEGVAIPLAGGSGGVRPNVFMANYDKDLLTSSLQLWGSHELETGYADYSKIEVGDYIIGYGVYGDDYSETHTKNFMLIFKVESFDEGKTLCYAKVVGRSMETSGSSGGSVSGNPSKIHFRDAEQIYTEEQVKEGFLWFTSQNYYDMIGEPTFQDYFVEYGTIENSNRSWIRILAPTSISYDEEYSCYNIDSYVRWYMIEPEALLDENGQIPAERLKNVLGDINTLLTTLNSGEGV